MGRKWKRVDRSSRVEGAAGQNTPEGASGGEEPEGSHSAKQTPREALGLALVVKEGRNEKEN